MAECYVTARDYAKHFNHAGAITVPVWNGRERRKTRIDRRRGEHERRWDKSRGRRFRLADRRAR